MAEDKSSILLSDVSIEGDLVEKDKIVLDAKVTGDIKADTVETYSNSNINGNITAKNTKLGGKLKGNINSDKIKIQKTDVYKLLPPETIIKYEHLKWNIIKDETL